MLPTVAGLTRAPLPPNPLDGVDLRSVLSGEQDQIPREAFLYFNEAYLQAARLGSWKMHLARLNSPAFCPPPVEGRLNLPLPAPELYDVIGDVDESHDRAGRNYGVVADLRARIDRLMQTFPADIQDGWARTLARQVYGTPAGCLPIERNLLSPGGG